MSDLDTVDTVISIATGIWGLLAAAAALVLFLWNCRRRKFTQKMTQEEEALLYHLSDPLDAQKRILFVRRFLNSAENEIKVGRWFRVDLNRYLPAYKTLKSLDALDALSKESYELSGHGWELAQKVRDQCGEDIPDLYYEGCPIEF